MLARADSQQGQASGPTERQSGAASVRVGFPGAVGPAATPGPAADRRPAPRPPGLDPTGPRRRPRRPGRGAATGPDPPNRPPLARPLAPGFAPPATGRAGAGSRAGAP